MAFDVETLGKIQVYGYVIATGLCSLVFYGYIYHLYNSEKKGEKDYEKYTKIALDDEINSTPLETTSPWDKKKKIKGESA